MTHSYSLYGYPIQSVWVTHTACMAHLYNLYWSPIHPYNKLPHTSWFFFVKNNSFSLSFFYLLYNHIPHPTHIEYIPNLYHLTITLLNISILNITCYLNTIKMQISFKISSPSLSYLDEIRAHAKIYKLIYSYHFPSYQMKGECCQLSKSLDNGVKENLRRSANLLKKKKIL